jgi:hypothetical protein
MLPAAAGLLMLVAGCTAGTQSPAPPHLAPSRSSLPPAPHVGRPAFQRGIDIDLYTYPGQNVMAEANTDVRYALALHANAVSVSFPFFMSGSDAPGVYTNSATPSPSELAVVAREAEQAGLYVSIRPLLDETSLGMSRVGWKPRHPTAWFASYRQFLLPYAEMAQREHIPELFVGAEFDRFGASPRWKVLDGALRRVYHGRLAYARNWNVTSAQGGRVTQAVDAYPPFSEVPASASVSRLTHAWKTFDQRLPRGLVETEVGIAAVSGAYAQPWKVQWPGKVIDSAVQARWFTAACLAAQARHLGGISRRGWCTCAAPSACGVTPGVPALRDSPRSWEGRRSWR